MGGGDRSQAGSEDSGSSSNFSANVNQFAARRAELEPLRPFCTCGCGEQLDIPQYFLSESRTSGVQSVLSHWKRHPYKKGHGLWDLRTEKFLSSAGILDADTLGLIYGTLLGDASITYPNAHSRFPRLAMVQSEKQCEWLEYKAKRLSILRPKIWTAPNLGYGQGNLAICCNTACHPQLREVFDVVKPTGDKKIVTAEWLSRVTPEGLAWWYMDDGSLSLSRASSPFIRLHTEGFSREENDLIAEWLTSLGYPAKKGYTRHQNGKSYSYIRLNSNTSRKWLADLKQFAISSMAYKFRNH